jgi:hypothetical protein
MIFHEGLRGESKAKLPYFKALDSHEAFFEGRHGDEKIFFILDPADHKYPCDLICIDVFL